VTTPGIGASSVLGVALETTSGTYLAPTKFVPYLSEALTWTQATNWRRPIRNTPGLVGATPGFGHAEGDITLEALTDCVAYFLYSSRCSVNKVGASAPYTYTFTPAPVAIPTKTMSITIVRNGVVFGYTGCVVGSFRFEVSDGELQFTASILAVNETVQATPTGVTWAATVPFGAGQYNVQIPTATQVFDADTFTFESNDNATVQNRLQNANTGAQFVNFGESEASLSIARDFKDRTEYDAFKALTSKTISLIATHGAADSITILSPVSIIDTYPVNISSQGDLVRASITYQCAIDSTGKHYQITILTAENIT
jgi:hypothetical protein